MLVAAQKLDCLYDDALRVLRENPLQSHSFPVDAFRWNAACALIADAKGLHTDAAECAASALKFAELTESGFRHHPHIGLVGSQHDNLKDKLRRLAQS